MAPLNESISVLDSDDLNDGCDSFVDLERTWSYGSSQYLPRIASEWTLPLN